MATRNVRHETLPNKAFNYSLSGSVVFFVIGAILGFILQFLFPAASLLIAQVAMGIGMLLLTLAVAIYSYQAIRYLLS